MVTMMGQAAVAGRLVNQQTDSLSQIDANFAEAVPFAVNNKERNESRPARETREDGKNESSSRGPAQRKGCARRAGGF